MKKERYYKLLYLIAAIYDSFLGTVFCFFYKPLFKYVLHRSLPEPPIYFQVCAAFIAVTGLGFFYIYRNLYRNIDLAKIGIAMKLVYCLAAVWHATYATVPLAFVIFGICDVIFIILFIDFLKFARASGKVPT